MAGTVTATLKNISGATAPASGTRFVLYTSPPRQTNGSNPATFSSVPAGTYGLEGYYTGTFWGEEYWGDQSVAVPTSGTVYPNITRFYPYASTIALKIDSTSATISPGQSVQAGTQLRVEVTIQNSTSYALQCRPHVAVAISRSSPYDFDLNWTAQSVSSGGSLPFSQTFTPSTTGQYYFAYEVWTPLLNGNTLRTDSAGWQQTFQIVCPTPSTPSNPNPANGATGASPSLSLLDWADTLGATSYDVYFGTSSSPPYSGSTTSSQWPISGLAEGTTYYWKIVAWNSCGSTDGSLWSFTTARTTGDVNATLKTANGVNAPSSGSRMVLYTSPLRQTNSSNPALFAFLPPGTYTLEGYYTGTFWGEEYWASGQATVVAGQTANTVLPRQYPCVYLMAISNMTSGGLISPGQFIMSDTQVRAYVTVTNAVSSALNTRVNLLYDLDTSTPYDYTNATAFQSIPANGVRTFTLDFTPATAGQYYFSCRVDTTLLNGNTLPTDSAGWQQTFQVLQLSGRIAFHRDSDNTTLHSPSPSAPDDGHIFVYNLTGDAPPSKITAALGLGNAMNPHFSPDGSKVTFMAIPSGQSPSWTNMRVCVLDLAENTLSNLCSGQDPKFSPDGSAIVFKMRDLEDTQEWQVFRMQSDGSLLQRLTKSAGEKSGPNYSPDGSQIVFWLNGGTNADIWLMSTNGTGAAPLVANAGIQDYYPIYRDANNILYTSWDSATPPHPDKIFNFQVSSDTSTKLGLNSTGETYEDADAFPAQGLIGFSSTRKNDWPDYDLYIAGDSGSPIVEIAGANSSLGELGGVYSQYTYARKLKLQAPANGATLAAGGSYTLQVRAYSDGGIWSGTSPSVTLQGPVAQTYSDLRDDGTGGDAVAGDGVYSKTVTLPAGAGTYTVSATAQSAEPGVSRQVTSPAISVILVQPPSTPTANPATGISSSGFIANWSSASGATGYRLDVSTSSVFASFVSGYQGLDVGNVTSQGVTGLTANTPYYYRVRAYNTGGTSDNSGTVSLTTSDNPPSQPSNVSPSDGATNQSLTLTLQASPFSDPDTGDTHAASQWRVRRVSDSVNVFDSGADAVNKTSITVPAGSLAYATTFSWMVRYKDSHGMWSSYSTATPFTTQPPPPLLSLQPPRRLADGRVELLLDCSSGWTYLIQASSILTNFTSICQITASSNSIAFTDTNALNFGQRFYRALGFSATNMVPHPADLNADFSISSDEYSSYNLAYHRGFSWPIDPSPVPDNYYTIALQIFLSGQVYHCNPSLSPPDCWVPGP